MMSWAGYSICVSAYEVFTAMVPVLFARRQSIGCGKSDTGRASSALVAAVIIQRNDISVCWRIYDCLEQVFGIQVVSVCDEHPLCGGRTRPHGFIGQVVQKSCKQHHSMDILPLCAVVLTRVSNL